MGIYDIAMLIVFFGAILFGYWKGLVWQIASVSAIIVSYIVAVNFRDPVAGFIQAEEPWNRIGAMLILFILTSLAIWTVYASVAKSLKKNELKGFDRQTGAMLGAVKGVLLCMVITMFAVSLLGESAHESVDNSRLGPYVEKGIWQVSALVPAELAKYVDPHIASYKEASGHAEPTVNPREDFKDVLGGSSYPVDQSLNQNASQIPTNQPSDQGYPGSWQTPGTQTQYGNRPQPNYQVGTNYGTQSSQQTNWNQPTAGGVQTTQNQFSELDITEVSKQILEQARQQGIQIGWEAIRDEAKRRLENAAQQR